MEFVRKKLTNFAASVLESPVHTLACTGARYFHKLWMPARVEQLRGLTQKRPLILQVETINVCNAACVFCAYPSMKRAKGVMSLALFEKIIHDYSALGGGALSFTPVSGDALLDPHLLTRLETLEAFPSIDQLSLTTNGIALDRFSDDEVRLLLRRLHCIQVSIGGLDRSAYHGLYGVDRFQETQKGMERLILLAKEIPRPAHLIFAFRTNEWDFTWRHREELASFRGSGVYVSHICNYDNYSGVVSREASPQLLVNENCPDKEVTCIFPRIHMAVCWDGRVTACGCVDFEGDKLPIGNVQEEDLAAIWGGSRHNALLDSFPRGTLPPICRGCSAYRPDTTFAELCFKGISEEKRLPLSFFQEFWGG